MRLALALGLVALVAPILQPGGLVEYLSFLSMVMLALIFGGQAPCDTAEE